MHNENKWVGGDHYHHYPLDEYKVEERHLPDNKVIKYIRIAKDQRKESYIVLVTEPDKDYLRDEFILLDEDDRFITKGQLYAYMPL